MNDVGRLKQPHVRGRTEGMMRRPTLSSSHVALRLALGLQATCVSTGGAQASAPEEVQVRVRDSLAIIVDVYHGPGPAAPTIILFHQGGGNARGEYRAIAPRLLRGGYNVIAPDIRGGGDRFGETNRVAQTGPGFRYCDALGDVEAVVNMARARGFIGPLVLWGSSYSASLVLQVAARRAADVGAVLAFSPASGEPMGGCEPAPYVGWLARAGVPTLVLRPREEIADRGRAAALEAMRRSGAQVFVAERGAHGSSMLDSTRTGGTTEPQWNAVFGFLHKALAPRPPSTSERALAIPSDGWILHGDLRLPARTPAPIVVLLHKAAGSRAIYRSLAERLAAVGIGSLRVDLRGHGASVNRGRFIPGQPDSVLAGTARDIAAVWRYTRALPEADTARLGAVSASYSSQAAALAAREVGFGRAEVALSPGDFTDSSFRAAAASKADWLFVRSDSERFVGPWLDAKVQALVPRGEMWVVPAGSAHASDLLAADSALVGRLAQWLHRHLSTPVRLTYLANEGVMLASERGRVLIDALFGDGLPDYAAVPRPSRDSLERASAGYGGPALVLSTHAHRDHYDSAAVARYLASNRAAVAIGPPDTAPSDVRATDLGWVSVRPLPLPHGTTTRPVAHAGYLVTLDGVTAVHLGDANGDPRGWPDLGLPVGGVDIALVPYWYALDGAQFRALLGVVPARTIVLLHVSRAAQEGGGWPEALHDLRVLYPQVRAPSRPGESVELMP